MYTARYGPRWMHDAAAELAEIGAELDVNPATLAIAWCARHPGITAPIISARSARQLSPSLAAATLRHGRRPLRADQRLVANTRAGNRSSGRGDLTAMPSAIVIGGGVAGLTAGAELADRGLLVTLFERESVLGYHASGRSAAMFEKGYGPAAVQHLTEASETAHIAAGVLSPRELMLVGSADQAAAFHADVAALTWPKYPLQTPFPASRS